MTGNRLATLVLLAVLVIALPASSGAEIRVSASLDRESARIGEEVSLTVIVEGSARGGATPELPELLPFTVFNAGTSQNIQIINGSFLSSQSYSYVLVPLRSGAHKIGPIEVERDGRVYRTAPMTLFVEDGSGGAGGGGGAPGAGGGSGGGGAPPGGSGSRGTGSGSPDDEQAMSGRAGDPMFLTATLSKDRAYVNEAVTLSIKFYRRINPVDTPEYTPPTLTGFWVEELPPQRNYEETVRGVTYMVTELRSALFPTAPGTYTVGSANLRCQVPEGRGSRRGHSQDPFDALQRGLFGELFGRVRPVSLRSDPLTLQVLPVPDAGKPEGYAGAVGRFSIEAELDPPEVPAGEPSTLRITMRGRGNVKSLPDIAVAPIPGVRMYDSQGSVNVTKENYEVSGRKVVEKILVPGTTGRYIIPPITVACFEPGSGYATIRTDTLTLVATASRNPLAAAGTPGSPSEIATGERDIRHIRPSSGRFVARDRDGRAGPVFIAVQVLPLVAMAVALGMRTQRRRRERDPGYQRFRQAGREARRRMSEARSRAAAGDRAETPAAVARGIVGYLADRLELPGATLTPVEAADALRAREVEEALVLRVKGCLEACDLARFAPGAAADPAALVREAEAVLNALEDANLSRTAERVR